MRKCPIRFSYLQKKNRTLIDRLSETRVSRRLELCERIRCELKLVVATGKHSVLAPVVPLKRTKTITRKSLERHIESVQSPWWSKNYFCKYTQYFFCHRLQQWCVDHRRPDIMLIITTKYVRFSVCLYGVGVKPYIHCLLFSLRCESLNNIYIQHLCVCICNSTIYYSKEKYNKSHR